METIKIPTIQELYDMIIDDYKARTSQEPPLLRRAVIKFMAWAFAGVVILLWRYGAWQYLQVFVDTASLDALKKWGDLRNIEYNDGQTAILTITLEGVTASTILNGTIWKSLDNGLTYQAITDTPVVGGVAVVSVQATVEGSSGNLDIGSTLNLTNPLTGIPDTAEVTSISQSGEEAEDIETYRTKVIVAYKRPPQGGSASDYFLWVTEVEGIEDCLVYVITAGQVDLYPIKTGSGTDRTPTGSISINPFPTWTNGIEDTVTGSGQKLAIYNSIQKTSDSTIQNRRPIQVPVTINDPEYVEFGVEIIGLDPTSAELRAGIKGAIQAELDSKRPHIPALNYSQTRARINQTKISAVVQETIEAYGGGGFTSLDLFYESGTVSEYTLGVGELSVLSSLIINGIEV